MIERHQRLLQQIAASAQDAGRSANSVQLIAVSKNHPIEQILALYNAGQRHFGESRPQALRDKSAQLPSDICWHFIGPFQRNKARYLCDVHRLHSLESVEQALALSRRATQPIKVLISVNLGDETQKTGVRAGALFTLCERLQAIDAITLCGLMCIPPSGQDAGPFFKQLSALADEGVRRGYPLRERSMGMSADYRQAIHAGATWVRVGTALFGPREG